MLILCAGTATDVGKTWVGAATLQELRGRGHSVSARKPVQSFDPDDDHPLDAEVLALATGEDPAAVCRPDRAYPVAMAPPMAAVVLGETPPAMAELLTELQWPTPPPAFRWLETVGGPRSPIAVDGDAVELTHWVQPDVVVLVADAGLGAINAVQLSRAPFVEHGYEPIVVLNRYDPADVIHRRNAEWLTDAGAGVVLSVAALVGDLETLAGVRGR